MINSGLMKNSGVLVAEGFSLLWIVIDSHISV